MILHLKNLMKRRLLVTILLVVTICISLVIAFVSKKIDPDNPLLSVADATSVSEKVNEKTPINLPINSQSKRELPVLIKIPSINVNAKIESVGLTPTGAMDAPVGPKEVGWFSPGILPGDKGSSVMDGHSGWKNNIPAVFDDLYKVKIGDKIYIEDKNGSSITFIVREIKKYDPNADASDIFSSNDGKAHLNLITCAGFWNTILKSHSERLVVFADLEI